MTETNTPGAVGATPEDREAAARAFQSHNAWPNSSPSMAEEMIRSGLADDQPFVQAFARHRLSAQSPAPVSGWRPIESAPDDAPFLAGLWVTNNKTGARWWETYIIAIDDETGEARGHPDDEPLPWSLQDFEGWMPLPDAPPAPAPDDLENGDA